MNIRHFAGAMALVGLVAAPGAAQDPETLRPVADQGAAERAKLVQEMVDSIFSFGELGFQEVETSRYLTEVLRENGFTVEDGISGIPTAWLARWGSGSPVIALGSDLDGIPGASQKPGVAYHDPMEAMRPFYYDPERYDTYLEQLGIEYLTVRESEPEGSEREH